MKEVQSPRELRGVPLVGPHRSSAIPGTAPLPALLAKERAGKLVLTPRREPIPVPEEQTLSAHYERRGAPLATRGTRAAGRFFRGRR